VSPFARHLVKEVMERNVATLPADLLVDDVLRRVLYQDQVLGEQQSWPIVDDAGKLVGLVTRGDLIRAIDATDGNSKLVDIGARTLVVTYPDELLEHAVQAMARAGVGRLPVVDRRDRTRLIGMLDRKAMAEAYLAGLDEEQVRETGETSQMVRDAARRLRMGRTTGGDDGDDDKSTKLTG